MITTKYEKCPICESNNVKAVDIIAAGTEMSAWDEQCLSCGHEYVNSARRDPSPSGFERINASLDKIRLILSRYFSIPEVEAILNFNHETVGDSLAKLLSLDSKGESIDALITYFKSNISLIMINKMKILTFEKPKKITNDPESLGGFCGGPEGGYIPNMSQEDIEKYKAKKVGGEVPRVEIRVSHPSEVLIKVKNKFINPPKNVWNDPSWKLARDHGSKNIKISMNGPVELTFDEWEIFKEAINEAVSIMQSEYKDNENNIK